MPMDDDVVRGSGTRPAASLPSSSPQEVAPDAQPEKKASANPLLPAQLPAGDVPEVLRDVVTGTISRPTLPLALLAIVVLFLLAQNRIDRRDPKLASAPVEAEPELDFTTVIRRPGGALA